MPATSSRNARACRRRRRSGRSRRWGLHRQTAGQIRVFGSEDDLPVTVLADLPSRRNSSISAGRRWSKLAAPFSQNTSKIRLLA